MNNETDFFKKLCFGAKFDFKRFEKDAEKFQLKRKSEDAPKLQQTEAVKPECLKHDEKNIGDEKVETESEQNVSNVRKRQIDDPPQKRKKRRKGANDPGVTEFKNLQVFTTSSAPEDLTVPKTDETSKSQLREKKQQIHLQQVSAFRKRNRIHVYGTDVPDPIGDFDQLAASYNISPVLINNITAAGYQHPTAIQMQTIPLMMRKRELLACAPTGSGKTAAFLIPILTLLQKPKAKGFRAVIVSPTRELAKQTYRECSRLSDGLGFRIRMITKTAMSTDKFGEKSSKRFDILITTPNRLVFMLKRDPPGLDLSNAEWLIVDESDKLFEEGSSGFREQLATIYQCCNSAKLRHAMFSATFAQDVEQWCKLNFDNIVTVTIGTRNVAADTVSQDLLFVGSESGKLLALRALMREGFSPPMLIFVQSKERAKELHHELMYDNINMDVIHADRPQAQRDEVVKSFRSGKIWVLVCTDLMGRGIDFKGVNVVLNYDFPTSVISYIHRIGRTGRAGRSGRAITYFTEEDTQYLKGIANVMKENGCFVPDWMMRLKKPNRTVKKMVEKIAPRRPTIRTTPTVILEQAEKRKKIIRKVIKKKEKRIKRTETVVGPK